MNGWSLYCKCAFCCSKCFLVIWTLKKLKIVELLKCCAKKGVQEVNQWVSCRKVVLTQWMTTKKKKKFGCGASMSPMNEGSLLGGVLVDYQGLNPWILHNATVVDYYRYMKWSLNIVKYRDTFHFMPMMWTDPILMERGFVCVINNYYYYHPHHMILVYHRRWLNGPG